MIIKVTDLPLFFRVLHGKMSHLLEIESFSIQCSLGPPRGRGVRGAPSKNAGAGIPALGPGPVPAKFGVRGAGDVSSGQKSMKQAYLDCV